MKKTKDQIIAELRSLAHDYPENIYCLLEKGDQQAKGALLDSDYCKKLRKEGYKVTALYKNI